MQDNARLRERLMVWTGMCVWVVLVIILWGLLFCNGADIIADPVESTDTAVSTEVLADLMIALEPIADLPEEPVTALEETDTLIWRDRDPNNDVYPYSNMSEDWGSDIYDEGYAYYQLPSSYAKNGGMFPEVAQVYLWCMCKEAGVDYYMVLALIERESGYRYDATGDSGYSKGLMQVQERFHTARMEALGATDLYNPYDNMRVAVNFLAEIQDKYLASSGAHCVLMVYNMGATGANKLWAKGIYSTAYTQQILQRAQEIKQELQDQ